MKVQIIVNIDADFLDGRPDPDPFGDSNWTDIREAVASVVRRHVFTATVASVRPGILSELDLTLGGVWPATIVIETPSDEPSVGTPSHHEYRIVCQTDETATDPHDAAERFVENFIERSREGIFADAIDSAGRVTRVRLGGDYDASIYVSDCLSETDPVTLDQLVKGGPYTQERIEAVLRDAVKLGQVIETADGWLRKEKI